MLKGQVNVIEACDKAITIVSKTREMDRLYRRGVRTLGEGELRTSILDMAMEAIEDENLKEEVFASEESMLSFFCGVWIQFLLTEIAGVKKEKLRTLAQRVFADVRQDKSLH